MKLAQNEQYNPSSIDFFLPNMNVQGGTNNNPNTPSNLDTCDGNCFLVTKQHLSCSSCTNIPMLNGQDPSIAPAYAMISKHGATVDIAYWFFFPYNRGKRVCIGLFANNICPCGSVWGHCLCPRIDGCIGAYSTFAHHVGDWEHIVVRLINGILYSTFLSIHNSEVTNQYGGEFLWNGRLFQKGSKTVGVQDTHPIIYAAEGSHGIWYDAGKHVYKNLPNGDTLVDYTSNGRSWKTWRRLKVVKYKHDGEYTGEFKFINFQGRWGNPKWDCGIAETIAGECILNDGPHWSYQFLGTGDLS